MCHKEFFFVFHSNLKILMKNKNVLYITHLTDGGSVKRRGIRPRTHYLRIASNAFWYSCSAKSYSRDKIWICSKVTPIPVRSLPLLQLVNLRPGRTKKNDIKFFFITPMLNRLIFKNVEFRNHIKYINDSKTALGTEEMH